MNMAYFIDGKVALKQDAKMKVSGGGSRKQLKNLLTFPVKKVLLSRSFLIFRTNIIKVYDYVFLDRIEGNSFERCFDA